VARIVFWLGPAVEKLDPATAVERGVGGSETAAIHLSGELARLGHQVVVYADVAEDVRHRDVAWMHYGWLEQYRHMACDVFVSSRQPEVLSKFHPACRQAWLWMHDLHCGPDWEDLIGRSYDRVLCLSEWARERFASYYPAVDESKLCVTSNAVDPALFREDAAPVEVAPAGELGGSSTVEGTSPRSPGRQHRLMREGRLPARVTYSSSPDRGLEKLLMLWPRIRGACLSGRWPGVCEAELHVYYGFETWRRMVELHGRQSELARAEILLGRLESTPGVAYHGRVGQDEVARSFLRSQLWLYPTDFLETSCITAMEAQAAGCRVVTTRCGALPETVVGGWLVDGPTTGPGYDERFLAAVVEALDVSATGEAPAAYAPRTWADVAGQWSGWVEEASGVPCRSR
jgi:glycosyltransferase involved in cell wall biosynthesis